MASASIGCSLSSKQDGILLSLLSFMIVSNKIFGWGWVMQKEVANAFGIRAGTFIELCITIIIFSALSILLFFPNLKMPDRHFGDNLLIAETVDSIVHGKGAVSLFFASSQEIIDANMGRYSPDDYVNKARNFYPIKPRSWLKFHFDTLVYPMAALSYITSPQISVSIFYVMSFTGMLLVVYVYLRHEKLSPVFSILFVIVVMFHPVWGDGLNWQYYTDRTFMLFGLLFFIGVEKRWGVIPLSAICVVGGMTNERALSVMGLFLVVHAVCCIRSVERREIRLAAFKIIAGIALVVACLFIQHKILTNIFYENGYIHLSVPYIMNILSPDFLLPKTETFFVINGGLLVVTGFRWRLLPIVLSIMAPNLIATIGGAERTEFMTHYHTYYFTGLVFGAMNGYVAILGLLTRWAGRSGQSAWRARILVAPILAGVVLFQSVDWGVPGTISFSWPHFKSRSAVLELADDYAVLSDPHYQDNIAAISRMVPPGGVVAGRDILLWPYRDTNPILAYPFGLDYANYLIGNCVVQPDGRVQWNGGPVGMAHGTGIETARGAKVEAAMQQYERDLGFDLDHPVCSGVPFSIGVVARMTPATPLP